MAYDLFLFRRSPSPALKVEEIDKAPTLRSKFEKNVESNTGTVGYSYVNEDTDVYCSFIFESEPDPDFLPESNGQMLSFHLNFLRPCFFAAECLPFVMSVARELDLQVYDPQEDVIYNNQESSDTLLATWIKHNERAITAYLSQTGGIKPGSGHSAQAYCPREKMNYWWRFTHHKAEIESAHAGQDIYVPEEILITLRASDGAQASLTIIWADLIPVILPEVDYVMITRSRSKMMGLIKKEEAGVIPFARIREIMGSELTEAHDPVQHYIYSRETPLPEVQKAICEESLIPWSEFYDLTPDSVLDYIPPEYVNR